MEIENEARNLARAKVFQEAERLAKDDENIEFNAECDTFIQKMTDKYIFLGALVECQIARECCKYYNARVKRLDDASIIFTQCEKAAGEKATETVPECIRCGKQADYQSNGEPSCSNCDCDEPKPEKVKAFTAQEALKALITAIEENTEAGTDEHGEPCPKVRLQYIADEIHEAKNCITPSGPTQLPIVKYDGFFYYFDERCNQLRNIYTSESRNLDSGEIDKYYFRELVLKKRQPILVYDGDADEDDDNHIPHSIRDELKAQEFEKLKEEGKHD